MLDIDGFILSPQFLVQIAQIITSVLLALFGSLFSGILGRAM